MRKVSDALADAARRHRLAVSLVALLGWLALTLAGSWRQHEPHALVDGISRGVAWPILLAAAFLTILATAFKWNDLGIAPPRPCSSLRIMRAPALYLVLFLCAALAVGLPPAATFGFLALNTLLVGYSEELMFRGVLFRGLRTRLTLWPAVWTTSTIFGAVHLLNALTTGDPLAAALQSVTAFMSGTFFLATVLRTRSLLPAILYHALWDLLLTATVAGAAGSSAPQGLSAAEMALPVLLILPNFAFALFLLRKVARDDPAGSRLLS